MWKMFLRHLGFVYCIGMSQHELLVHSILPKANLRGSLHMAYLKQLSLSSSTKQTKKPHNFSVEINLGYSV